MPSRTTHYKEHNREVCLPCLTINLMQKEKASDRPVNKKFSAVSAKWPAHCAAMRRHGAELSHRQREREVAGQAATAHCCPDIPLLLHACSAVHGVPKGGGLPAVQEHWRGNCCIWRENHALIKGSQLCWQAGIPGVIQRSQVSFEAFSENQPGEKGSALWPSPKCEHAAPELKTSSMLFPA